MSKALQPWEREDLVSAVSDFLSRLQACIPSSRTVGNERRYTALCGGHADLLRFLDAFRVQDVVEPVRKARAELDVLILNPDPKTWDQQTPGIAQRLTGFLNDIGAELPQGALSKIVSPAEAGPLYGISPKTFVRWIAKGKIRARKITSKSYQIDIRDLPSRKR